MIHGHVGGDPAIRHTQQNKDIAEINIGVSNKNSRGEDTTTWYRAAFLGKQQEFVAKWVKKGSEVIITGDLEIEEWQDRNNEKRFTPHVKFGEIRLVGKRPQEQSNQNTDNAQMATAFANGELPF